VLSVVPTSFHETKKASKFVLVVWWSLLLLGSTMILIAVFVEARNPHFWNSGRGTRSTTEWYFVMGTILVLLAVRSLKADAEQRKKKNRRPNKDEDA
jgi:hypothetical protein